MSYAGMDPRPQCMICGRPLYSRDSIRRGVCGLCDRPEKRLWKWWPKYIPRPR